MSHVHSCLFMFPDVRMTDVHFVLLVLDRSAGMSLMTEQTAIRALVTERHSYLVSDKT